MTYGQWLDRARDEIRQARTHLPTKPAVNLTDISAALVARQGIYRGLARLVEILNDGAPARPDIDRDTVNYALELREDDVCSTALRMSTLE